jgi:hypothetical protein
MSTMIPNGNSYVGVAVASPVSQIAPKVSEVGLAVNVTDFLISLNASFQGSAIPIPKLSSSFETSIPGTQSATFTAEFYRDALDANDIAFKLFTVGAAVTFYISRFGGMGASKLPILADKVEVWPVLVTSVTNSSLASNTAQTFTLTCSVPKVPSIGVAVAT